MKAFISSAVSVLFVLSSFAQVVDSVEIYLHQGVELHDKGDFKAAISCYEKALAIDNDNIIAMAEMAYSLSSLGKYEPVVRICQKAIETDPAAQGMITVYNTYGNALDALYRPQEAIEIYDMGIKYFPNNHLLPFNKAITLTGIKKYDEAITCLQSSTQLNPGHPGSHNAMGQLLMEKNQKVPALLALSRFMILEPLSARAQSNLETIKTLMKADSKVTGKKSVTLTLDPTQLGYPKNDKKVENNFAATYLILVSSAALTYDKKYKNKNEVELFIFQFESLCKSMDEILKDNFGFYWEYYAPYFIELYKKDYLETFAYLVFASTNDNYVHEWLNKHEAEIDAFYNWSESYDWTLIK